MNPVHQTLRQYRILTVLSTLFIMVVIMIFVDWMTETPYSKLSEWHLAPVTAALPALIGGLFAVIKTFSVKTERDEYD